MRIPFTNFSISINATPKGEIGGRNSVSTLLSSTGVRVVTDNLWSIYRMNADVFSCIREWQQAVGDGGVKYVDPRDKEMEARPQAVTMVKTIMLNSGGDKEVFSKILLDLGVCGNHYAEIVRSASGSVHSLKRLDPRTMFIIADKHGTILKYVQRRPGSMTDVVTFDPSEIVHIKLNTDPDNELIGLSPLETAVLEARTDIASAESNYTFFENNAVPGTIFMAEDAMSPEEQEAMMEAIKSQFGGSKNRNKSGVLMGIKDIKQISLSQKDMEFINGRKFNTDKICSVYGVPKFMLGYTETVNYSSGAKLLEKTYRGTFQPLETLIANAINNQFFVKIGIADQIQIVFLPQTFGEELELTRLALEEFRSGALTLRQYKSKTGQPISAEDEQEVLIDKHIIHNGASAVLLDDVGVDPVVDPTDPETAQNMIKALEVKFQNYVEDNQ